MGCLCQYYRCPARYQSLIVRGSLSEREGYFKFGKNTLYGRLARNGSSDSLSDAHRDVAEDVILEADRVHLPFDPEETLNNLRFEKYCIERHAANSLVGRAYYLSRPLLPVKVRRQLQRVRLKNWRELKFPQWPVDSTVDNSMADLLRLSLQAHRVERVPFIWFWPEGATSAAVITHDVEAPLGKKYSPMMMDIDDSFGIKASFSVVPEERYEVLPKYIDSIWDRGFEVAVHDLNHDGRLYRDRETFLQRVSKINRYRNEYRADGFRSAVLYRNQQWYGALDFSYDSSVPSVAHLDPQRGGCCTVMPYLVGKLVELPVTLTQDYSLFHILNDYSIDLWKLQIELIMQNHGLINAIIHPDYITGTRERAVFESLLLHLVELRTKRGLWTALPKDVARWWRQRSAMNIIEDANGLRIEGEGSERARIAYASEKDGRLLLEVSLFQEGPLTNHA
jgi:hypothetical protein